MGYHSDVVVALYTRDLDALPFSALKLWFEENYPRKEAAEWGATIDYSDTAIVVTYAGVKWYPDYGHVQAVRRALDRFDECFDTDAGDGLASWEMAEVGENMTDIQTRNSPYADYRLSVQRTITFD